MSELPWALRENVLDYAAFVEDVAPARAEDMGIELNRDERDRVVFLAGLMHLRDVVAGQLALVELATRGRATPDVRALRMGSEVLRPDSAYVVDLRRLRKEFDELLGAAGVLPTATRLSDAIELVDAREH